MAAVIVFSLAILLLFVLLVLLRSLSHLAEVGTFYAYIACIGIFLALAVMLMAEVLHDGISTIVEEGGIWIIGAVIMVVIVGAFISFVAKIGDTIFNFLINILEVVCGKLSVLLDILADQCEKGFSSMIARLERRIDRKGGE